MTNQCETYTHRTGTAMRFAGLEALPNEKD